MSEAVAEWAPSSNAIELLGNDLLALILSFVQPREWFLSACRVCGSFHEAVRHKMLWRTLSFSEDSGLLLTIGSLHGLLGTWLNTAEMQQVVQEVSIIDRSMRSQTCQVRTQDWQRLACLCNVKTLRLQVRCATDDIRIPPFPALTTFWCVGVLYLCGISVRDKMVYQTVCVPEAHSFRSVLLFSHFLRFSIA